MTDVQAPSSEAELVEIVQNAVASQTPIGIEGSGTRHGYGRPMQTGLALSTSNLRGITLLEPAEMIFSAKAGTPLSEVETALAEHGQMLTFEPMDHRPLYGSEGEPTIGAVAAGNISGPRRIMAGGARDSLIGLRFVNGRGELIKNGGRVMKNVTGLDLVKLLSGSWGTLGVLSEVTFKVLPKPEDSITLELTGLNDKTGIEALCAAMRTPFEVTGAAHLPSGIAGKNSRTLMRLEGFAKQLDYRFGALSEALSNFGKATRVDGDESTSLWEGVRDCRPFAQDPEPTVWRISVAPTKGQSVASELAELMDLRHYFDWSGGLIWVAIGAGLSVSEQEQQAQKIRGTARRHGGYASLVRAPNELKQSINIAQSEGDAIMQLASRVKTAMDPDGLFNPGRLYTAF